MKKTALLMVLALAGFSARYSAAGTTPVVADFVLTGGKVFTVDGRRPWAEAIAVVGDKIARVGSNADVQPWIGRGTRTIDLAGKLVLPGFVDAHVHPVLAAAIGSGISIQDNSSVDAVVETVRRYVSSHPETKAFFGFGWSNNLFGPRGPTSKVLDRAAPDRPVLLISNDGHAGWMNSAAIRAAGITRETPDPVPGLAEFVRDTQGEPTGAIKELATFVVVRKLGLLTPEDIARGATKLFQGLSRQGVTCVFDAGAYPSTLEPAYKMMSSMVARDALPFRCFGSYLVGSDVEIPGAVEKLEALSRQYDSDRLRIRTLKFVTDGTLETRKAAFFEPYLDTGVAPGITLGVGAYHGAAIQAAAKGLDVHIHAIGDKAVHEALSTAEAVRAAGHKDTRITICHVQVWRDEDRKRFKEAGVFVNFTGSWHYREPQVLGWVGPRRYARQFRYKVLADDGVVITQGSDFPAADTYSPLASIQMAHTRSALMAPGQDPGLPPPEERLPLDLAVRTYTINAARQIGMGDKLGSIEEGKYADLVVLGKNIFEVNPNEIHSALPVLVMMNGRIR